MRKRPQRRLLGARVAVEQAWLPLLSTCRRRRASLGARIDPVHARCHTHAHRSFEVRARAARNPCSPPVRRCRMCGLP